jgi:hypothetical protein
MRLQPESYPHLSRRLGLSRPTKPSSSPQPSTNNQHYSDPESLLDPDAPTSDERVRLIRLSITRLGIPAFAELCVARIRANRNDGKPCLLLISPSPSLPLSLEQSTNRRDEVLSRLSLRAQRAWRVLLSSGVESDEPPPAPSPLPSSDMLSKPRRKAF